MKDTHTIDLEMRIGGDGPWRRVEGYRATIESANPFDSPTWQSDAERDARDVFRQFVAHLRAPGGRVSWWLTSHTGAKYRRARAAVGSISRETTPLTLPALIHHAENCDRLEAEALERLARVRADQ
jgi:hypothetical protein